MLALLAIGCRVRPVAGEFEADLAKPRAHAFLEYIAHSCFRIESATGDSLLLDPYAPRTWLGYDFPAGIQADAFLITHPHYDHDAGQSVGREFPWGEKARQIREPGRYEVGGIAVTAIAGRHAREYGEAFENANTIFVITVDDVRLVHLGDNGPVEDDALSSLRPVDVLMIPVDDDEHLMTHAEVDAMLSALDARVVIPMHYRLAELEADDRNPPDLGGIHEWLALRRGVVRRVASRVELTRDSLPDKPEVWVPSPDARILRPHAQRAPEPSATRR